MTLPVNCKTEAQRLSYAYGYLKRLIAWHNTRGKGTDSIYKAKEAACCEIIKQAIADARVANFHAVDLNQLDTATGNINFPVTVKPTNEGSKLSYLHRLNTVIDLQNKPVTPILWQMTQAVKACEDNTFWTYEEITE